MKLVIFDLDGTLADGAHREHHITQELPKNWDAYFAKCRDDRPVAALVLLYTALRRKPGTQVLIWTGRVDTYVNDTIDWINEHLGVEPHQLRMREAADRTADDELKRKWLRELRADPEVEIVCVFEDRARVVKMWREEGIVCLQVREGDF